MLNNLLFYFHIIAESIPISSSGHYTLLANIFGINDISESQKYLLHIPSLFVILLFLYNNIALVSSYRVLDLLKLVFISNSFTGLIYLFLDILKFKNLKKMALWIGFFITAIFLLSLQIINFSFYTQLNFKIAIFIGLSQGIALLPGISRLGITYFMGILLSLDPVVSLYFSLLIEFPLILAALILPLFSSKISYNNILYRSKFSLFMFMFILVAIYLSYYLLDLVKFLAKNNLVYLFGYYMFIPTVIAYLTKNFKKPKA